MSTPRVVLGRSLLPSSSRPIHLSVPLLPPAQPGAPRGGMVTSAHLSPREPPAEPDRARHGPAGVSSHPLFFGSAKRSLYLVNGPKRGLHACAQREKAAASSSDKPLAPSPESSARPSPSPPKLRVQASCQPWPSASCSGCSGCLVLTTHEVLRASLSEGPFHATSSPQAERLTRSADGNKAGRNQ